MSQPVISSGTLTLGTSDPMPVRRLGFGAMRITGKGIWGNPPDHDEAIRVLRTAVELGVDLIDTADAYGPFVSEDLIKEALYPYDGVIIATKGALTRQGPDQWNVCGRPEYLRQSVEMSLRRLGVERIDLWQLHRIDPTVPLDDQLEVVTDMQAQGKIRHFGLSEVSVDDIKTVREKVEVVTVQNMYHLGGRASEAVLDACAASGIGFIPWFPLGAGNLAAADGPLAKIAGRIGATPAQVSLAWLLGHSPVMLPIPGTGSVDHVRENCGAAEITLTAEDRAAIEAAASA
jgi:aryl-alcohol dehydrogenase-like predicted oxidoreductase